MPLFQNESSCFDHVTCQLIVLKNIGKSAIWWRILIILRSTWKNVLRVNSVVISFLSYYFAFSTPGLCCHRRLRPGFSEGRVRRSDGLYSVSRGLDNIVFPSVIPYRGFASDEATPLTNDPRWLY